MSTGTSAPLFSITIPTFNRANLLGFAVRSILAQTFGDFEVVISDNWSTDATPRVAAGFADARVRYVRPERHLVTVDSFEFARRSARGDLVMVLNDDDALAPGALARFAEEFRGRRADFMFSDAAEYRDRTFPGPGRNTVSCSAFDGTVRVLEADEFLRPCFAWRPRFNMHPSAFVFARGLADAIASRCGRFFQSNGVEYCAWPLAAAFAERIVHIDAPLAICGRTGKSWGANLVLGMVKRRRMKKFIHDYYVDQTFKQAPLTNFTMCNLIAEGFLTAKALFPKEFEPYRLDEPAYLRGTVRELRRRRGLGVDVSREFEELKVYLTNYPDVLQEVEDQEHTARLASTGNPWRRLRALLVDLGARRVKAAHAVRRRLAHDAERVRAGDPQSGFWISGAVFGFNDIVGAAKFLSRIVASTDHARQAGAPGAGSRH